MEKQFFPIGTVVLLKEGEKRLMIHGLLQVNQDDGKTYDYVGCLYPEGWIDAENTWLFNNEDIERVDFLGYIDSEQQDFRARLNAYIQEENS